MNNEEIAISVKNLSKSFRLPHEKISGIKQGVINLFRNNRGYEEQKVLDNISFDIKKGEFFGIVGRNGSGKSTLLKILAGIYTPDSGSVHINGSLTPFIELGVGFNPELTGRENVFLNGALLGFSRKEMAEMYDDIVEFAELERFMDQKLKNYSSGMQVRLAFSIAIRAKSDILLLDEVLAVGDESFQRKCASYFRKIKKTEKTVVLVTHDMENVRKFCDKAILLDGGQIKLIGKPEIIADEYSLENFKLNKHRKEAIDKNTERSWVTAKIISKQVLTRDGELLVEATYRSLSKDPVLIKFAPLSSSDSSLMTANSKILCQITTCDTDEHKVRYRLPLNFFNNGDFKVVVLLSDANTNLNIASYGYNNELLFKVSDKETGAGGSFINFGTIKFLN